MPFIQFLLRRGTALEWTNANPVLAEGEVGLEKDTMKFKVGDGSNGWNDLAYTPGGEGSGDVVGPEGATAGNLATFSGTSGKIIQDSGSKVADFEPAIGAKGTAFNKNFGSSAGDVCQGNDSRLSDARTPTTHGNDKHSSTYITGTTRFLNVVIDGGGEAIETGIKCDVVMPACTIVGAYLLADQSGSIKIDLWKDSYANFPPTNDDSICGGNEPEISSATKDSDTTLTDWTTSVSDGDIIRVNVDSCTTIERCTLSLKITT